MSDPADRNLGSTPAGYQRTADGGLKWLPPSPEQLAVLLPEYEIVKMLGRGGMGAVYMGRQLSLDRPVAIKILSGALEDSDMGFKERFKNEARAMGRLNFSGIVAVHDFGETGDGLLYIVMEYVDGTDVARMIAKQGRLPTDHAMAITAHVCDALGYAHERGIIHRDIKPANIMVGYDGVVKVADFGLAKMTQSNATGLTQSGMAMGTLHYMAPEALMLGSAVDHRADIYAVGVMLYQMLTGKIPQGMFELPSLQVTGLDPRYDGIIAKALREDRERRYQSIRELRADLDGILTEPVVKVVEGAQVPPAALQTRDRPQRSAAQQPHSPPARARHLPAPAPRGSNAPWLWVAGLVGSVVVAIAWLVFSPADDAERSRQTPAAAPAPAPGSSATTASKDSPFINTLGMKFVPVQGTSVLFCIHETRRQDYATYAAEVPNVDGNWKDQQRDGIPIGDKNDHPVVCVSWDDSQAFCAWLSMKEGKTYRLPTDKEWSYAVGIGEEEEWTDTTTPVVLNGKQANVFPWGGDYPPQTTDQAGNYADMAWKKKFPTEPLIEGYNDGFPTTAPVMSFKPNTFGIYDMGGNVSEWCEDWFIPAQQKERVLRGGSFFHDDIVYLLSSRRDRLPPDNRRRAFSPGFRVVVEQFGNSTGTVQAVDGPAPPGEPVSAARLKEIEGWLVGSTWKADARTYYFASNGKGAFKSAAGEVTSFSDTSGGEWRLHSDGTILMGAANPKVFTLESAEKGSLLILKSGQEAQTAVKVPNEPGLIEAAEASAEETTPTGAPQAGGGPAPMGEPVTAERREDILGWLVGTTWTKGRDVFYFAAGGKGVLKNGGTGEILNFSENKNGDGKWEVRSDGTILLIVPLPWGWRLVTLESATNGTAIVPNTLAPAPFIKTTNDTGMMKALK